MRFHNSTIFYFVYDVWVCFFAEGISVFVEDIYQILNLVSFLVLALDKAGDFWFCWFNSDHRNPISFILTLLVKALA